MSQDIFPTPSGEGDPSNPDENTYTALAEVREELSLIRDLLKELCTHAAIITGMVPDELEE